MRKQEGFRQLWAEWRSGATTNSGLVDTRIKRKRLLLVATTACAQMWSLPPGNLESLADGCAIVTLPRFNSLPTTGTLREAFRKHLGDF